MELDPITSDEASELYIEDKKRESSDATVRSHRSHLGHFLDWSDEEGIDNMNDLTARRARTEGKWLGEVPVGFERNDEGYLRPSLTPDEDEDGYIEIREALEFIEEGTSYNAAAKGLNTTRQTLSRIDQDEERRAWYLNTEASSDDRVDEVLQDVQH